MRIKLVTLTLYSLITSIVLTCTLFSISILADNDAVSLKVGYTEFPPLNVSQPGTIPTGELADIIFQTLDKGGFSYTYQRFPTKRLYKNMGNGTTHVSAGIKGQELYANNVLFGKKVLLYLEERIFTIGDREIPKSIDGLLGKKIGIKRGYGYGGEVVRLTASSNIEFVDRANSTESSLALLQHGRVDFVLDYKHPVNAILEKSPIPNLRYRTIAKIPVYFAVSKLTPNAQEVLETLEELYNRELE